MPDMTPNEELTGLLKAISEDGLSSEQHDRLEAILRDDPAARKRYLQYIRADALLTWRYAPMPDLTAELESGDEMTECMAALPDPRRATALRPAWRRALNVAAVLILGLLLGLPLGLLWNRRVPDELRASVPNGEAVAVLAFVGDDVRWNKAHSMPRKPGSDLGKGWMQIDAGTIGVKFRSGATVQVEGPAVFGIDSPMRGFLEHGRASVYAPEGARDFVVGTAAMEVVDLGTRFTISVAEGSGESKVGVLEGLVDLHVRGEGTQRRIQTVPAGQTADVDAAGRVVRIEGSALDAKQQSASDLLAHWRLDDVDATGRVADASGNGRHGKLHGNAGTIACPGKAGGAFDLTKGGYIDLRAHLPSLTSNSAFTIAAWVCDAKGMVFSVSDGTPRNRVQFERFGNLLLYGWQKGGNFDHIAADVAGWETGRWYHVAVSVSGGMVTLYRDGHALQAPCSRGMQINTPSLGPIDLEKPTHAYIGYLIANHANAPQFLGGKIDDVQIYRRALDERAIRYLYEHPGQTYQPTAFNP
jgi:hypothetical protein